MHKTGPHIRHRTNCKENYHMKIRFTADSTCDMSAEFRDRYQVELIPLSVELEGKYYKDGVDIFPDDII